MQPTGPVNAGRFLGGGPGAQAIAAAMQRRGIAGGATLQNSTNPSAPLPVSVPATQNANPAPLNMGMQPTPQAMQQAVPQMTPQQPAVTTNPQADKIIQALTNYLGSIADIQESQSGVNQPVAGVGNGST